MSPDTSDSATEQTSQNYSGGAVQLDEQQPKPMVDTYLFVAKTLLVLTIATGVFYLIARFTEHLAGFIAGLGYPNLVFLGLGILTSISFYLYIRGGEK